MLVAYGLHQMIAKCQMVGLIKGMVCRDEDTSVINLQYADDTLLFGRDTLGPALALKGILLCFEKWSGLRINFHKSALIFLGDISMNNFLISLIFNCLVNRLPLTISDYP